jgi:hypothetical protein
MLVSDNDPNTDQDQKADLTYDNFGTGQDKRKTVDPLSEETKLDVTLCNPDPEEHSTEEMIAQDNPTANPLQVLLEATEVVPDQVHDPEPTKDNMAAQG